MQVIKNWMPGTKLCWFFFIFYFSAKKKQKKKSFYFCLQRERLLFSMHNIFDLQVD